MSKTINYNINFTAGSSISLSGGTQTLGNLFTTGGNVGIGITAPSNTLHVAGDLRVSSFITTSNLICTNLTTNSLSIPVISDVPAIDPNMTNTLIVHEDFRGTTLRSGTTSGTAVSYVQNTGTNNGYLQLTSNAQNQNGNLSWKINPGNAFTITFDHYAGGGNGADLISFNWGSNFAQGVSTGYSVEFNENLNYIKILFNNALLTEYFITNLDNSTWHRSIITFYRNQIRVIYDGAVVINYTDTVFRNVNGAYMYFYSFTGSDTNFHRIRNIRMSKLTEGLWQYQESTSGNIVYNGGNVGINTSNPTEMLDVRGNIRIGGSNQSNYIVFNGVSGDGTGTANRAYIGERLWGGNDRSELLIFKGDDTDPNFGPDRIRLLAPEIRFDVGVGIGGPFDSVATYGSTNMIIATNGSVGIGTNTPLTNLHFGTNSAQMLTLYNGIDYYGFGAIGSAVHYMAGSNAAHIFYSNSSFGNRGTETVRISGAGNVGIGTSSPSYKLDISSNSATDVVRIRNSNASGYASIAYNNDNAVWFGGVGGSSVSNFAGSYYISTDNANFVGRQNGNWGINVPLPNSTLHTKSRFATSGNLLVVNGTNPASNYLGVLRNGNFYSTVGDVRGGVTIDKDSQNPSDIHLLLRTCAATGTGYDFITAQTQLSVSQGFQNSVLGGNVDVFRVRGDGNVTNLNNSYGGTSDIKLKENIEDARNYLEDLSKLRVVKYSFKNENLENPNQLGLIAQEVEQVFPGLIEESEDKDSEGNSLGTSTKSIKYSIINIMMLKAVQELRESNNKLNTLLQDQEKEIKMLKDFIMTKFPGELN